MGRLAPQGAARTDLASWKPSDSASTRSTITQAKGGAPPSDGVSMASASLPEREARAPRPSSAHSSAMSLAALSSSSTIRTDWDNSASLVELDQVRQHRAQG